jgi:5-methylcytosine-specific restriction enzyme subunit McrC
MLLGDFSAIGELSPKRDDPDAIRCDRRQMRFEPLAELARLLLGCRSPDRPGATRTFSLVFDMNVVFERFIAAQVARVCSGLGLTATAQGSGRSLLLEAGKPRFALRPDIVVSRRGEPQCLIDTKWKRLDRSLPHAGVSQADMYQMYAYGKEYPCRRVIVLYPRHTELPVHLATYHHAPGDSECPVIEVRTIDIGADQRSIRCQLEALIHPLPPTPQVRVRSTA